MLYKLILSYINTKIEIINTKMVILATEGPLWNQLIDRRFPRGIAIAFGDSAFWKFQHGITIASPLQFHVALGKKL